METGYKILRKKRRAVNQRTQKRTNRGRKLGTVTRATIERELLAKRELLPEGKIAVELMDEEIKHLAELERVLYPWDAEGHQLKGKSVNAYYWAAEMRRDYLALRAPYQSPRLSAVQVIPAGQAKRQTTVNVTILNEQGEREFTDLAEDDGKLIEHAAMEPQRKEDEEAA